MLEALSICGLIDFCTLVETVVLHERLVTIGGDVDEESARFLDHPLLTSLTGADVLRMGAIRLDVSQAKADITNLLGEKRLSRPLVSERGVAYDWAELLPEGFEGDDIRAAHVHPRDNHDQFMMAVYHPASEPLLHGAADVVTFLRGDQFGSFITGTGEAGRASHVLRSYLYYSSAVANCMTLVPDYQRIPYFSAINEHLRLLTTSIAARSQELLHDELSDAD
jgi:hypothetical protein